MLSKKEYYRVLANTDKKKLPTALDLVSVLSFNPTHGLSSIKFGHSVIELTRTFGFRTLVTLDRQGHGGNSWNKWILLVGWFMKLLFILGIMTVIYFQSSSISSVLSLTVYSHPLSSNKIGERDFCLKGRRAAVHRLVFGCCYCSCLLVL